MMSPRWRKVSREIWQNKSRNLLVIASIAVGVFAIGLVLNAQTILSRDMDASYQASNPASVFIFSNPPFDDELIEEIGRMPEVETAQGRRRAFLRFQDADNEWRNLEAYAVSDFEDIQVSAIEPVAGAWPPPRRALLVERASEAFVGKAFGDTLTVRTPSGVERTLPVVGTAYDINQLSAEIRGRGYGYVSMDTMEWFGYDRTYEQLHVIVSGDKSDRAHIEEMLSIIRDRIEGTGREVEETFIPPTPGRHPEIAIVQAMVVVLGVLGVMSLLLSGFLVVNTISAVLAQQVRQIGVMKSIGARTDQIVSMYLSIIFVFGVVASVIAIPLATIAARLVTGYVAQLLNFDIATLNFPPWVMALELAVGILVPLFAGSIPVIAGTRITIREAISSYGLGGGELGQGIIGRILRLVQGLPRAFILAFRNTFRSKGRLALTLFTLTLGGGLFIGVMSVQASAQETIQSLRNYWDYDIELFFQRDQREVAVANVLDQVPEVVDYELWALERGRRVRDSGIEGNDFQLVAPPIDTNLMQPNLIEGRWLIDGDANALVINSLMLKIEPDLTLGSEVTLLIDGDEQPWRIVGITQGPLDGPTAFVPYTYLITLLGEVGAQSVRIVTAEHSQDAQSAVNSRLETLLPDAGIKIQEAEITTSKADQLREEFTPIVVLLSVMAVLIAAVGGLGLVGTMSINVIERTREIGVMRSIGASNGSIQTIVIVEGIVIGLISWVLATGASIPIGRLLSDQVGLALMETPLSFQFSWFGVLLWLATALLLASAAAWIPARAASRIMVREALSYG